MDKNKKYWLAIDNMSLPLSKIKKDNQSLDMFVEELIDTYGTHLIGIFEKDTEAFQAYLVTKELGLDNISFLEDY